MLAEVVLSANGQSESSNPEADSGFSAAYRHDVSAGNDTAAGPGSCALASKLPDDEVDVRTGLLFQVTDVTLPDAQTSRSLAVVVSPVRCTTAPEREALRTSAGPR